MEKLVGPEGLRYKVLWGLYNTDTVKPLNSGHPCGVVRNIRICKDNKTRSNIMSPFITNRLLLGGFTVLIVF